MAVTMESCPSVGGPLPPEGSNGLDNDMETLFEISEMSPSEVEEIQNGNSYIKELTNGSYLSLLQPTKTKKAFQKNKERGLFHLIFSSNFFEACLKWTNDELVKKGESKVSKEKYMAYVGLEIATSLVPLNNIRQYWENKKFSGHQDFKDVMSQNDFQTIRGATKFHPPEYDNESASKDPLWNCRPMLKHFQKNSASHAVPVGSSALDENACRTNGRTRAKSYIPMKPIRFGIRFYVCTGARELYNSSMADNGTGNTTGTSHAERYIETFRDLRLPFEKCFQDDPKGKVSGVAQDSASALWVLQLAHQTKKQPDPNGKRVFFMDNFYTRHVLGEKLKQMTDGEACIVGTCKLNLVNKVNAVGVKKAIELLADQPRGSWALVRAYNNEPEDASVAGKRRRGGGTKNASKKQRTSKDSEKKKSATPKEPTNIAEKAGYIVYKDSKIVVFYTNDLAETPPEWYGLGSGNEEAIRCVRGLAPLHHWTGETVMHRQKFMAPAIVVAYNIFMSAVDRMDQQRATNPCQCREKRVTMSVFTMLLDLSINNAYAIAGALDSKYKSDVGFREFKRRITEQLVMRYVKEKNKKKNASPPTTAAARAPTASALTVTPSLSTS